MCRSDSINSARNLILYQNRNFIRKNGRAKKETLYDVAAQVLYPTASKNPREFAGLNKNALTCTNLQISKTRPIRTVD